jgi:hypothetical protein
MIDPLREIGMIENEFQGETINFSGAQYAEMGIHDPEDGPESPESGLQVGPGTSEAGRVWGRRLVDSFRSTLPGECPDHLSKAPGRRTITSDPPGISHRGTPGSQHSANQVSCGQRVFSPRPSVPDGRQPGESRGRVARHHPRSRSSPHFRRAFAERRCGRPSPDTGSAP